MLSNIFEFLFCPQHGLLRPDTFAAVAIYLHMGMIHISLMIEWIRSKFR